MGELGVHDVPDVRSALGFDFVVTGEIGDELGAVFASFTPAVRPRTGFVTAPTTFELRPADDAARYELVIDGRTTFSTSDLGALVHQSVWEITQRAVASRPDAVVLHSAVVRLGETLVVISGPSGSGKSTLATSLLLRGAGYLTDEAATLDSQGMVVETVRRPIHLSRESREMLGIADPSVVPMPGGGGYLPAPDPTPDGPSEHSVLVFLEGHGGGLEVTTPRTSDAVAHLVRGGFTPNSRSNEGLRSIKSVSRRSVLMAISGGTVAERANAVENVTAGHRK